MAETPEVFNKDISDQLDKRMDRMLDAVEESGDAKAIAAGFRTLVEFSKAKPPQVLEIGGVTANMTTIGEKDSAR